MRARSGVCGLAAALAVLAVTAPTAFAARARRLPGREVLTATGSITYTWHGDPGRGCASASLCDVRGALVISHFDGTSLGGGMLFLPGAGGTVRVSDGPGRGECVDGSASVDTIQLQRGSRSRVTATFTPNSLTGRCAEPLGSELAAVAIPVKVSGPRTRPTFNLRVSKPYAAGPFSGTLQSTLVLRPAPPAGVSLGGGSFSSGSSGSLRSHPTRPVLAEFVNLVFQGQPLPSALVYQLTGASDQFCQALDSCGTSGSLSVSVTNPRFTLTLSAVRRVHRRVSRGRALADFRRGNLPFSLPGFVQLRSQTAEQLTRPDGSVCRDTAQGQLQLTLGSVLPGARDLFTSPVPVALIAVDQPADVLRTRCPGPLDADIFGQNATPIYARGSIATSTLLSHRLDLSLLGSGTFSSVGYGGSRRGSVALRLTRVSLHAGTEGVR